MSAFLEPYKECREPPKQRAAVHGYLIVDFSNIRNIVLVLPPAPAALVLVGRALAALSARSAAAFLLTTVFAPPGGDEGRAVVEPGVWGVLAGELDSGEDYIRALSEPLTD